MKNVVGPRIRDARRGKGHRVTQVELAARLQAMGLEIDQSAISKIENGERLVTDIEIVAICQALGISPGSLFTQASAELPFESDNLVMRGD